MPVELALLLAVAYGAIFALRRSPGAPSLTQDLFRAILGDIIDEQATQGQRPVQEGAPQGESSPPVEGAAPQTLLTPWHTPAHGRVYDPLFAAAASQYRLPPSLLSRVAFSESNYNPTIVSSAGAVGLMQLEPKTAAAYGCSDPTVPEQAVPAAARYLAYLFRRFGDWRSALAAYNWGEGNVANYGAELAPASTQAYVLAIAHDVGL
jgi:soluble lytic murein transglycosylase-like protein